MPIRRLLLALSPAVAAAHVGYFYSRLPLRVASHFNLAGDANGWMSRTAFAGSYVVLIALMAVVYCGLGWLLRRVPNGAINLPRRDYWLAPERRERTLEDIGRRLAGMGIATVLFLMVVFQLCIRANLDGTFRLPLNAMTLPLAFFITTLALWLGRIVWRYGRPEAFSAE